jgi:hypothetical protein
MLGNAMRLRPAEPDAAGLGEMLGAALHAAERVLGRFTGGSTLAGKCGHEDAAPGYRIPDSLRGFVEARDQDCGFPCCRQPAWRCDIDHTIPHDQGGPTCRCNLSAECRRHHRMKQLRRWRLRQLRPGVLVWATPAGLTYTAVPGPHPA